MKSFFHDAKTKCVFDLSSSVFIFSKFLTRIQSLFFTFLFIRVFFPFASKPTFKKIAFCLKAERAT